MKKLAILTMAAFLALGGAAMADSGATPHSYTANVIESGGKAELSTIFFDYEEGVWHGAPVARTGDLSAWRDIDLEKHAIVLEDGRELGVLDNGPAYRGKDGKLVALK